MSQLHDDVPTTDALFDGAPCGLVLTDSDGTIRRLNAAFCHWLGYTADELTGKRRIQDLLTMGGKVFHQTHWVPLLQMQGSIAEVKADLIHRDGHQVPMLINAVRRRHGDRVFDELALLIVTDRQKYESELLLARGKAEQALAERREAEVLLQQLNDRLSIADQRKDEFLATLAHELRNPLAPMRNVMEVLRIKNFPDTDLVWAQGVLSRQLEQLTRLVDDLLELSRITQGKLQLRKVVTGLVNPINTALESVSPLIDSLSHELVVDLSIENLAVHADPVRLSQILLNLLNNAAKYTPPGGKIWLCAKKQGNDAVLTVRDSGIGIGAENLLNVFEMFSQLSPALERSQGGLGVGLALVRGLVELHGGTVKAFSEGAGRGSEFVVRLPLVAIQEAAAALNDSPETIDGRRILVVDDNHDAASSLALLLQFFGHEIATAADGQSALNLVAEFKPAVVLLDIGLPVMNGYEVARRIRQDKSNNKITLVALTGWGQEEDKKIAFESGFNFHLTKPVDIPKLQEILSQL